MDIRAYEKTVSVTMTMGQWVAIRDLLFELKDSQYETESTKNLARILGDEWVIGELGTEKSTF